LDCARIHKFGVTNHPLLFQLVCNSRDGIVGIAPSCGLNRPPFESRLGVRVFSFLQNRPDRLWCPPSLLFVGIPRVHETDPWPPSAAGVKNEWSYTSLPPICFRDADRAVLPLPVCIEFKLKYMSVSAKAVLRPAEYCSRHRLDCSAEQFSKI
jgi:hypothetical protein